MNTVGSSYFFWLGWFFGLGGLHRIYNKKFFSGFLWLFTLGLLGVGQFVDLILIPSMVDEHNLKVRRRLGLSATGIPLAYDPLNPTLLNRSQERKPNHTFIDARPRSKQELMVALALAAQKRGGKISVTQAVVDTRVGFEEIKAALNEMVKQGYVDMDNHPNSGIVVYEFLEL